MRNTVDKIHCKTPFMFILGYVQKTTICHNNNDVFSKSVRSHYFNVYTKYNIIYFQNQNRNTVSTDGFVRPVGDLRKQRSLGELQAPIYSLVFAQSRGRQISCLYKTP